VPAYGPSLRDGDGIPARQGGLMSSLEREAFGRPAGAETDYELPVLGAAPDLEGVHPWLNTLDGEPLTLQPLRGRIVLLEFWTFACRNCQRTLPFLSRWHERYSAGLTVVGVHTPERPFERSLEYLELAVIDFGLEFPVGVDNDYVAWNAYGNRYWPSQYLIDRAGLIRYAHAGEGGYKGTEAAIRALLGEPQPTGTVRSSL
jgi:thiol-disulfide isomerase/thioredoxin